MLGVTPEELQQVVLLGVALQEARIAEVKAQQESLLCGWHQACFI